MIQIYGQPLGSEYEYKDYYKNNISTLDPIEGIWSVNCNFKIYKDGELYTSGTSTDNDQVAIISEYGSLISTNKTPSEYQLYLAKKNTGSFNSYSLTTSNHYSFAERFTKTAIAGVYLLAIGYTRDVEKAISLNIAGYDYVKADAVITSEGIIQYSYEVPQSQMKYSQGKNYDYKLTYVNEIKLIKIFPSTQDIQKFTPSSGSGFAISSNGIIVTNHHVINEATNINVRGINGDFSKTYKAKILVDDKNNDLAIIKIDDNGFTSLGGIPYIISNKSNDVGCSIYCLGYPLRATMGDEVKLTNGIISSKSGFQGDITTYQITAPVQPGNSGGPLFDDKGNLIGIINARHSGAENVSYAIKTPYLINLLNSLPSPVKLQTVSALNGKSLSDQVKLTRNFTYIIETN